MHQSVCLTNIQVHFLDDVANKIANYLPRYQNYIESLKNEGYTIIGYARKSPSIDHEDNGICLLQAMCDRLKERSMVDAVIVSVCCKAVDPIAERDLNKDEESLAKLDVVSDMQGE